MGEPIMDEAELKKAASSSSFMAFTPIKSFVEFRGGVWYPE